MPLRKMDSLKYHFQPVATSYNAIRDQIALSSVPIFSSNSGYLVFLVLRRDGVDAEKAAACASRWRRWGKECGGANRGEGEGSDARVRRAAAATCTCVAGGGGADGEEAAACACVGRWRRWRRWGKKGAVARACRAAAAAQIGKKASNYTCQAAPSFPPSTTPTRRRRHSRPRRTYTRSPTGGSVEFTNRRRLSDS
uniref:Uncharacterized protein n=1 Tax=Oryza nivara TaxID=4536 RepID=A0A0E0FL73_ORYNI